MDGDLLACIVAAVGQFVHLAALPTMTATQSISKCWYTQSALVRPALFGAIMRFLA
jgi:hypothetical protein